MLGPRSSTSLANLIKCLQKFLSRFLQMQQLKIVFLTAQSQKKKSAIDFDFNLWDKQITAPFSGFGSHMNMNKCANNFPKIQLQKSFACHRNSFGFQNRIPKEQTIWFFILLGNMLRLMWRDFASKPIFPSLSFAAARETSRTFQLPTW